MPDLVSTLICVVCAAELGRIDAGLHLELLQRIDGGHHDERIEVRVGVLHAVERVVVEIGALAGNRNRLAGADAALARRCLSLAGESGGDVRRQRNQLQVVAAVQRQFDDALVLDHRADGGVLGGQQRGVSHHLDGFDDFSHLQFDIDAGRLLHMQFNLAPDHGLESGLSGLQRVSAGRERRKRIDAGFVGNDRAGCAGAFVRGGDRDTRGRGAGDVARLAGDRADVWPKARWLAMRQNNADASGLILMGNVEFTMSPPGTVAPQACLSGSALNCEVLPRPEQGRLRYGTVLDRGASFRFNTLQGGPNASCGPVRYVRT